METTEKEQAAIKAIQELAKTWPRTLKLGSSSDGSKHFEIWKQSEPGEHRSVGKLKIRNLDDF